MTTQITIHVVYAPDSVWGHEIVNTIHCADTVTMEQAKALARDIEEYEFTHQTGRHHLKQITIVQAGLVK